MRAPAQLITYSIAGGCVELSTDASRSRIIFLTEDIVRLQTTFGDEFLPEFTYCLQLTGWEDGADALFTGERARVAPGIPQVEETTDDVSFSYGNLVVRVTRKPFSIAVLDTNSHVLMAELPGRPCVLDENQRVRHYLRRHWSDRFYGFGEKTGPLNKHRQSLRMDAVDTYGYNAEFSDPLYKHIPFYLRLQTESAVATGFFYHTAYPGVFDLGREYSSYWDPYTSFTLDGGDIDLFVIRGPNIPDVISRYAELTGKPQLPPAYALGYIGSGMPYSEGENPTEKILAFLDRCKSEDIPVSAFQLSSGYMKGDDGERYPFNWDRRFGNPAKLVAEVAERGCALIPNIKPGFLLAHPLYDEFAQAGAFVQSASGDTPQPVPFWGGTAALVDFTNPTARALWKEHLTASLLSRGITAIWDDNNEFESDPSAVCHVEGHKLPIRAVRPLLANLMAKTAVEAIKDTHPDTRPFVISRGGFAGIQHYGETWAGDNTSKWASLQYNTATMLGMSLSGVPFQGVDIGGFDQSPPAQELLVRWVQSGAFHPRFCIHSALKLTEPWMYPEVAPLVREAMKLRYRLWPYLYALAHEAAQTGVPLMRPLVYHFQDDPAVWDESFNFLLGPFLLSVPIFTPGQTTNRVYLPKGHTWTLWDSRETFAGGQEVEIATPLERNVCFVRSGAIIPMFDAPSSRWEENRHPCLRIEPSEASAFTRYEDDGRTFAYQQGEYRQTHITVQPGANEMTISFSYDGDLQPVYDSYVIELINQPAPPKTVLVDNQPASWNYQKHSVFIQASAEIHEVKIIR